MVELSGNQSCCGIAVPAVEQKAVAGDTVITLSLPTIHCAGCMSKIENKLEEIPKVESARVNLSLKRVVVKGSRELHPSLLIEAIHGLGYEALELNNSLATGSVSDNVARDYLIRLGVSGFVMMNVMLMSVAVWSGADGITRDMFALYPVSLPRLLFYMLGFHFIRVHLHH